MYELEAMMRYSRLASAFSASNIVGVTGVEHSALIVIDR